MRCNVHGHYITKTTVKRDIKQVYILSHPPFFQFINLFRQIEQASSPHQISKQPFLSSSMQMKFTAFTDVD